MSCTVCKHNQVKDIDRALLSGVSLTSLSQTYGFITTALQLHKNQLLQKMAQAEKRFHHGLRQGVFLKLYSVMEMVLGIVKGAWAGEDFKLFLQASRRNVQAAARHADCRDFSATPARHEREISAKYRA